MKKLQIKTVVRCILAFFIALGVLVTALVGTTAIPNEAIYDNMVESALVYKTRGRYDFDETKQLRRITDNYADNILLNVLWNMKSDTPFRSAFDTVYYDGEEDGLNRGLYSTITEGSEPNVDYTRYWHGMVVVIRPLMLIFNITQIKWIGLGTAVLLLAANVALLCRKKQYFAMAALVLSYLGVHFWWMVKSAEYQPAILLSLLFALLFVLLEKKGESALLCLAVMSGVCIAFFDFLTTETLTILIPLALVLLIRQQEERLGTWKDNLPFLVKSMVAWGGAYAFTFVAKWSLATLVLRENKFVTAFSSAAERIGGTEGADNLPLYQQMPFAVLGNISTLFGGLARVDFHNIVLGLLVTTVVFGSLWYLFRGNYRKDITILMLLLGLVPYLRYLVLNNHSYLHEFFTYRAQAVTILALLSVLWYNTDKSLLIRKKKRRRK